MKILIAVLFFLFLLPSFGQTFYFPSKNYSDSSSLSANIPVLAKQILGMDYPVDKRNFLNYAFHLQLLTGRYKEAINTIDTLHSILDADSNWVMGENFKYQVYARAKLREAEKNETFENAFAEVLPSSYKQLTGQTSFFASWDFYCDFKDLKSSIDNLLNHQKGKSRIDIHKAIHLCELYNKYLVYHRILPWGANLIRKEDNKTFIIEDSVLIKTRDNSTLSLTVVRKRDQVGKQPAILMFNIYSTSRISKEAAVNGYVGVVAYTRGKRLSDCQEIEPFEHDAKDAYEVIDWISKQAWSNGEVGMIGGSYVGFTQWAAAKNLHPALKTIVPQVSVAPGVDFPHRNNIYNSYMLHWLYYVTNYKDNDAAYFNNWDNWERTVHNWYRSGRSFRSLDSMITPHPVFQRWLKHPGYDKYWQKMMPHGSGFSKISIPVLTTTGYYDDDVLGAMHYFRQHHRYRKNAEHYLVIGPYDHNGAQSIPSATIAGYEIDPVAKINFTRLTYEWFDYILKDSVKPALLKDKINYQVMGANTWKHSPALSAMNNDTLNFYLSSKRDTISYFLDPETSSITDSIKLVVDFKNRNERFDHEFGLVDYGIYTENGIVFISDTVTKPYEINGSFVGELKASINKKDMDVCVDLYELMKDGRYLKLSGYLTRASYSKDRSKRKLLTPGKKESIPVNNSTFISRKIQEGSRLAVVVRINKNPYWQINYGTGKEVSDETIKDGDIPLKINWYTDSVIRIPVFR